MISQMPLHTQCRQLTSLHCVLGQGWRPGCAQGTAFPSPSPAVDASRHCGRGHRGSSLSLGALQSWGGEVPDWELDPASSDGEEEEEDPEVAGVLHPDEPDGYQGGGPEFAVQNVLAAVLLGALALSFGSVVLKLVVVGLALVSAAFRYTALGLLLFVLLAYFA